MAKSSTDRKLDVLIGLMTRISSGSANSGPAGKDGADGAVGAAGASAPYGDHDLLLSMRAEFGTKLDRVIADVAKLNDNYSVRIDALERSKLDDDAYDKGHIDHENRIRTVEKFQENLIGKLSILTVAISAVIALAISWIGNKLGI